MRRKLRQMDAAVYRRPIGRENPTKPGTAPVPPPLSASRMLPANKGDGSPIPPPIFAAPESANHARDADKPTKALRTIDCSHQMRNLFPPNPDQQKAAPILSRGFPQPTAPVQSPRCLPS